MEQKNLNTIVRFFSRRPENFEYLKEEFYESYNQESITLHLLVNISSSRVATPPFRIIYCVWKVGKIGRFAWVMLYNGLRSLHMPGFLQISIYLDLLRV